MTVSGLNTSDLLKDCFIAIDKPKGPTSHQVDYWVRQITGVDKVGHVGTLDPNASGLLVMALGRAVKLIDIAHEYPKEYLTVMRLYGDTGDDNLLSLFREFTGEIYQLPPMKSAVARTLRIRKIYDLKLMERENRLVLFNVKCESGTYIRTLCTDMGYALGFGAQMAELRRTVTGPFDESMMHTLQDLSDAVQMAASGNTSKLGQMVIPMIQLFRNDPKIVVKRTAITNIAHGSDLFPGGIRAVIGKPMKGDRVAVVTEDNQLIGTGHMLVNHDDILDLKVVDFDRILLDNPDQRNQTPVIREMPQQITGRMPFRHKPDRNTSGSRNRDSGKKWREKGQNYREHGGKNYGGRKKVR